MVREFSGSCLNTLKPHRSRDVHLDSGEEETRHESVSMLSLGQACLPRPSYVVPFWGSIL